MFAKIKSYCTGGIIETPPSKAIILEQPFLNAFDLVFSTDQDSISIAMHCFAPNCSASMAKTPVPVPMSRIDFPSNTKESIS